MPRKSARRPTRKTPESTPQANVTLQLPRSASSPKLPHERDESPTTPSKPDAAIVQAEHDLAQGQKDTDRYTDATKTFERGPAKKTR